jgi:hypothetical protein
MAAFFAVFVSLLLVAGAYAEQSHAANRSNRAHHQGAKTHGRARGRPSHDAARPGAEVRLRPALIRKLQGNLVAGGYLDGKPDGRLTPRTRTALARFQREYHLRATGKLDQPTAEALLGKEVLANAQASRR